MRFLSRIGGEIVKLAGIILQVVKLDEWRISTESMRVHDLQHTKRIREVGFAADEFAVDTVDPGFHVTEIGVADFRLIEPDAEDEMRRGVEHGAFFHAARLIERAARDLGEDEVMAGGFAFSFEERFEAFAMQR